jgi:mannose-6-phosphate isomerase-like protein (cupin superfamily)
MVATDQKPWYQKKKMDSTFPFNVSDCPIRNFTLHWHEPVEILYVFQGRMNASVEGQVFDAHEGDIVVVNSGLLHGISNVLGKDAMLFNFQFGLEIFDQGLVDLRDRAAQKSVFDRQPFFTPKKWQDLPGGAVQTTVFRGKSEIGTYRVGIVDMEPVYLEFVEPGEGPSPWKEFLDKHGPGIFSISFEASSGFKEVEELMTKRGMPVYHKVERGVQRYGYFDSIEKLGAVLEFKEINNDT